MNTCCDFLVKTGAVNEMLVKPESVELTEECREVSGLSDEALSGAAALEEALTQVGNKQHGGLIFYTTD